MRGIFTQIMRRPTRDKSVTCAETTSQSQLRWRFTGHVFYLLDTLKLTYHSQAGLVTYERVTEETLSPLCRELRKGNWVQPSSTANLPSLFSLSVCAVSWEQLKGSTRVKAIPDAAHLRFEDIDFIASEAKFQSPYRKSDDMVTPLSEVGGFDKHIRRVYDLSVAEFLLLLQESNQSVPRELQKTLNVQPDNFAYRFTDREEKLLERMGGIAQL